MSLINFRNVRGGGEDDTRGRIPPLNTALIGTKWCAVNTFGFYSVVCVCVSRVVALM